MLLVGDADVMPVRYMVLDRVTPAAFDYAFYPSDLYYADLAKADGSFEDWNGAKDGFHAGYFGEVRGEKNKTDPINYDGVDYQPEIAVGRWPVSTAAELRIVAAEVDAPRRGRRAARAVASTASAACRRRRLGRRARPRWTRVGDRSVRGLDRREAVLRRRGRRSRRRRRRPRPRSCKLLNDGCGLVFHAGHGSDDSLGGVLLGRRRSRSSRTPTGPRS